MRLSPNCAQRFSSLANSDTRWTVWEGSSTEQGSNSSDPHGSGQSNQSQLEEVTLIEKQQIYQEKNENDGS
jgi:hypothetical protein